MLIKISTIKAIDTIYSVNPILYGNYFIMIEDIYKTTHFLLTIYRFPNLIIN